ncbi:ATP-binding protein [Streptomyces noursei]|uniref:ATP-binding protein n=1 Tax=Streptomyces noursei TaxID=1971 RepID=UPI00331E5756
MAGPKTYERGALLLDATYVCTPPHVRIARDDIAHTMLRQGLAERVDDAKLLVSELVTNVVRHCRSLTVRVVARSTPDTLILSVSDDSPALPARHPSSPDDERGRGLFLLDLLTDEWGVGTTDHEAKTVWCCLSLAAGATPLSSTPESAL